MDEGSAALIDKMEELLDGRQICLTIGALKEYLVIGITEDAEANHQTRLRRRACKASPFKASSRIAVRNEKIVRSAM